MDRSERLEVLVELEVCEIRLDEARQRDHARGELLALAASDEVVYWHDRQLAASGWFMQIWDRGPHGTLLEWAGVTPAELDAAVEHKLSLDDRPAFGIRGFGDAGGAEPECDWYCPSCGATRSCHTNGDIHVPAAD